MMKTCTISGLMLICGLFLALRESPYVRLQTNTLKLHHDALAKVASDFEFLSSKIDRPIRIAWLGTLTPERSFSNDNIANLKQFLVLLQSQLAPSVLLVDGKADVYILFIADQSMLRLARTMFGDSLVVNENGYAFVVDPTR